MYKRNIMESGFGISYFHKKPEGNTNIIRAHMKEEGGRLSPAVSSDRTRGSVHKVKHDKFHLNMRKNFFEGSRALEQASQRGLEPLPLETLKTYLDMFLCILL